jgi:hypothetical protein
MLRDIPPQTPAYKVAQEALGEFERALYVRKLELEVLTRTRPDLRLP